MLPQKIRKLGETNEMADVKFIVEGEIFSAHRTGLVARSAVFKAELSNCMANREEVIRVEDMQASVFKLLLEFMYTDNLPDEASFKTIQCLMVAANRYALEALVATCQQRLLTNLTIDKAVDYLIFAHQHGFSKMKRQCIEFMLEGDTFRLAVCLKYVRMVVNYPSILTEIKEVANEFKSRV
ncbi:BTB/POZ domain containing protein [Rhynchospora pubera]|uniref:BTB/POZ domain containing protein n=1 Tax=Rhynchospora pubera TaxID=906938 RepID=A0AAV8HRU0_9POAL|nr:BTB/POZ domain containing protein [Rhynchospora pubera]